MFYDNYEQKILKYANIKNKIMRFKALIISVIALISALTIAFMSTKGMVLKEVTLPESITYGDTIECSSSALFSDILYYEYKAQGDVVWTQNVPTNAGEYLVRAVTKKTFGLGYSKEKAFTILPKELKININSDSVVYGGSPVYSIEGLEYSDKIEKITFDFENLKLAKTKVELDVEQLVINNSNGDDVTKSYAIKTEAKDITLTPYDIVIKPNYLTKEYDGLPLTYDNSFSYVSGSALFTDNICITTNYSTDYPVNVGTYINEIKDVKILSGNDDISFHYNVNKMASTLEITKRKITIKTDSKSKVYDSNALSLYDSSNYHITEGSLVNGHKLVIDGNVNSITNVGSIKNELKFIIKDENNNDVTLNYDITYDYGTLEVTPYDVIIDLVDSDTIYDGSIYSNYSKNFKLNKELFNNDSITISTIVKDASGEKALLKNVGSYYLHIDDIIFTSGGNDSVFNNYSFTYNEANITIKKRDITLEAVNQSSVYDGLIYSYPNNDYLIVKDNGIDVVSKELVDGSDVFVDVTYDRTPCDAGNYDIYINSHNEELNKNYNVSYSTSPATLQIERRMVTLEAANQDSIIYDSNVYLYPSDSFRVVYDNNQYVNNDSLIDNAKAIVNVEFRNSNNEIVTPKNAGIYCMYINSHNEKINKNYIVSYSNNPAYITILPKDINISLNDSIKTYDNSVFDDYDKSFTLSSILYNNDAINISTYTTGLDDNMIAAVNAGSYHLHVDLNNITFTSGGNDSIKDNYSFTYTKSNITIERRTITLEAVNQASKVYDSYEYSYDGNYKLYDYDGSEINSLVDNSSINVKVKYQTLNNDDTTATNVGKYNIYINSHNEELNSNYDVKYSTTPAIVKVTPLDVTINLHDKSKVYDGLEFTTYDRKYDLSPKLYNNDKIKLNEFYITDLNDNTVVNCVDVGSYYLHVSLYNVDFISGGNDSIYENYSFSYMKSLLTIEKRSITLQPKEQPSATYDSKVYLYPDSEFTLVMDNGIAVEEYSLIDNSDVTLEVEFRNCYNEVVAPKNAGDYYIYIVGHNDKLNKNYDVSYSNVGVLFTITAKNIIIHLKESKKIYDYTVFDDYNQEFTLDPSLYNNDSISIPTYITDLFDNPISAINAGDYYLHVDLNNIIFTSGGNDSIRDNYSFDYQKSNITIERRTITLEALDQASKVYDSYEYSYDGNYKLYDYDGSEINSLVDNSSIYVKVKYQTLNNDDTTATNVGKYNIYINSHNEELNANYDVKYSTTPARVEITPFDIVIDLYDDEKVYDAQVFNDYNKYPILSPDLFNNDFISLENATYVTDLDGSKTEAVNVGKYALHVDLNKIIFTSGGNDSIKDNYNFTYNPSVLTITKRFITLEAKPQQAIEYNSTIYQYPANEFVLVEDNFELVNTNKLIGNDEVIVTVEFRNSLNQVVTPKNAGDYYIYINSHNEELNNNYNVTYSSNGVLFTIKPCEIMVEFKPIDNHMFDGKDYDFEVDYKYIKVSTNEEGLYNEDKFTFGTIVSSTLKYNDVKNVDLYFVSIDPYQLMNPHNYFVSGGNDSVAANYSLFEIDANSNPLELIEKHTEKFSITPRPITLHVKPQNPVIYNAAEYIYPANEFIVTDENPGAIDNQYMLIDGSDVELAVSYYNEAQKKITSPIEAGKYYMQVESAKIFTDGKEFNNYLITYDNELVEFEILRREITLEAKPQTHTYNGLSYTYPQKEYIVIDNNSDSTGNQYLIIGEQEVKLNVYYKQNNVIVTPINVGEYDIYVDGYNDDSAELTQNYIVNISTNPAKLIINPVNVDVTPTTVTKIYNGKAYNVNNNDFSVYVSGSKTPSVLYNGDSIALELEIVDRNGNPAIAKNATTLKNYYVIRIKAESLVFTSGDEISIVNNYNFILKTGAINIKPRSVTLEAKPQDAIIYNTNVYEYPKTEYVVIDTNDDALEDNTRLIDGTYVEVEVTFKRASGQVALPKNADTYYMYVSDCNLKDNTNYKVSYSNQGVVFNINPFNVSIILFDDSKIYDAAPYDSNNINDYDKGFTLNTNLYNNDSIEIATYVTDELNNILNPIDAGEYNLHVDLDNINFISGGNESIISNYTFSYEKSIVTINRRNITLTAKEQQAFEYAGNVYQYPANEFVLVEDNGKEVYLYELIGKDEVSIVIQFRNEFNNIVEPKNAGAYYMYVCGHNIELDRNYIVKYSENPVSFTINPKKINIILNDSTKEYDGLSFTNYNKSFSLDRILHNNDSIEISTYITDLYNNIVECKNAGSYLLHTDLNSISFTSGENDSIKTNYVFDYQKSNITITPKNIDILLKDHSKMYDNTMFVYDGFYSISPDLLNNDSISITTYITDLFDNPISAINAGDYYLHVDLNNIIFTSGGNDSISDNYSFDYQKSNITIERRTITLEAVNQASKVYDSYEYSYDGNYKLYDYDGSEINSLADNSSINVKVKYQTLNNDDTIATNVGKYNIYINSHNEELNANYDVKYSTIPARVEITTRYVKIKAIDVVHNYNHNVYDSYDSNNYEVIDGSIITSHKLSVKVFYTQNGNVVSPLEAGKYSIVISSVEIFEDDSVVTSNYEIDYTTVALLDIINIKVTLSPNYIQTQIYYYGQTFVYPKDAYDVSSTGNINDDTFEVYAYYKDNNGNVITDESGNYISPVNSGTYSIYLYDCKIISADNSKYEIIYDNSNPSIVVIDKLDVTIKPIINESITYNFKEQGFTYSYEYVSENNFIGKDTVTFDLNVYYDGNVVDKLLNAGTYNLEIVENSLAYSQNYNVSYVSNTYTVKKLSIDVVLNNKSKVYDATLLEPNNDYSIYKANTNIAIKELELVFDISYQTIPLNAGKYNISINKDSIVAIDNDINNFNIVECYDALYEIKQREITITLKDKSKVYDGKQMEYDLNSATSVDYKVDNLVENEAITIVTNYSSIPTHAGIYKLTVTDYTQGSIKNYKIISSNTATLSIEKLDVIVELVDQEYTFNGDEFVYPTIYNSLESNVYIISDGYHLIANDKLVFNVTYLNENLEVVDPVFSGSYTIRLDKGSVKSYSNGIEYNDYNVIKSTDSKLTINKLTINLDIYDTTHIYDDTSAYEISVSKDYLNNFNTDKLRCEFIYMYYDVNYNSIDKPVNAGSYYTEYSNANVYYDNLLSQAAKDSIIFVSDSGKLKIEKRDVTIIPISDNGENAKIYDGTPYNKEIYATVEMAKSGSTSGLLSKHELRYKLVAYYQDGVEVSKLVNAGSYAIKVVKYEFVSGLETNYNVISAIGEIIIKRRPITISPNLTFDKYYDDIIVEIEGDEWIYTADSLGFIGDDTVNVEFNIKGNYITDDNTYADKGYLELFEIVDACNYAITIKEHTFSGNMESNYDISYDGKSYGIIKPISISVKTGSYEALYNGKIAKNYSYEVLSGSLVSSHIFNTNDSIAKPTEVIGVTSFEGEENILEFIILKQNENGYVLGSDGTPKQYQINYDITGDYGRIIVHKRPLTITTESYEFEYTGRTQYHKVYTSNYDAILSDGLSSVLDIHTLMLDDSGHTGIRNVFDGPIENILSFKVCDESGDDYIDCYDITYINGELSVIPYDLYVELNDYETSYTSYEIDANSHCVKIYDYLYNELSKAPLLYNDYFKSKCSILCDGVEESYILYGGKYTISLTSDLISITNEKGNKDYTGNYNIHFLNDEATVTVNKKNVRYETRSVTKLWNGEDISFEDAQNTVFNWLYEENGVCKDKIYVYQDKKTFTPLEAIIDGIPNFTGSKMNEYEVIILAAKPGAELDLDELANAKDITDIDLFNVVDVTRNYDIEYVYGTLSFDDEVYYEYRNSFIFSNQDITKTDYGVVYSDSFGQYIISDTYTGIDYNNVKVKTYIKDIYMLDSNGNEIKTNEIKYVGEYHIKIDLDNAEVYIKVGEDYEYSNTHKVYWENEELDFATINIYKSEVFVRPLEKIYTYDGNEINYSGFDIADTFDGTSLGIGHTLWIDTQIKNNTYTLGSTKRIGITDLEVYSINEYGEYELFEAWDDNYIFIYYNDVEIVNEDRIYSDENGNPIYDKADFRSKFKCNKIQLGIATESASKLYDGKTFDKFTDYRLLTEEALIEGHTFNVDYWYSSMIKAGTDYNDISSDYWKVTDSNGNNVSMYYEIVKKLSEYGELEITKRDIIICSGSASKPADGTNLYCNEVWVAALSAHNLGLADGDYIDLESLEFEDVNAVYVGEYDNIWSKLIIRNASGANVTKSYNITAIYGTLTITVPTTI